MDAHALPQALQGLGAHVDATLPRPFPLQALLAACDQLAQQLQARSGCYGALFEEACRTCPAEDAAAMLQAMAAMLARDAMQESCAANWAAPTLARCSGATRAPVRGLGALRLRGTRGAVQRVHGRRHGPGRRADGGQRQRGQDQCARWPRGRAVRRRTWLRPTQRASSPPTWPCCACHRATKARCASSLPAPTWSAWGGEKAVAAVRALVPAHARLVTWGRKVSFGYSGSGLPGRRRLRWKASRATSAAWTSKPAPARKP